MKMLSGLLPPTEGRPGCSASRSMPTTSTSAASVGYMSQAFSLYSELTVRQNLVLHARLFRRAADRPRPRRGDRERFGLDRVIDALPDALPLGLRQRLSLAVAMIHEPNC